MKTTLQGGGADHVGAIRRGMMTEVGAIETLGCIDTLPELHAAYDFNVSDLQVCRGGGYNVHPCRVRGVEGA